VVSPHRLEQPLDGDAVEIREVGIQYCPLTPNDENRLRNPLERGCAGHGRRLRRPVSAVFSSNVSSHQNMAWRRGTTSAWPSETGKTSHNAIASGDDHAMRPRSTPQKAQPLAEPAECGGSPMTRAECAIGGSACHALPCPGRASLLL
jgi:hypothetical protein